MQKNFSGKFSKNTLDIRLTAVRDDNPVVFVMQILQKKTLCLGGIRCQFFKEKRNLWNSHYLGK